MNTPRLASIKAKRCLDASSGSSLSSELSNRSFAASQGSRSPSPMSPLDATVVGDVSVQVLALTLNETKESLGDFFSSDPATGFNKGALDFLCLVEEAARKAESADTLVSFNELVVQLMDMDIDHKLPTPDHVAELLNNRGWNVQQVAQVWTVGP